MLALLASSCMIRNSTKEDCAVKTIQVEKIEEGGVKDLVLYDAQGDIYYINRGLEHSFTMEGATEAILNKTVTLHLHTSWFGRDSKHICQLEADGSILYTEFPTGKGIVTN